MARSQKKKWSHEVTENSDALDLKNGIFKLQDPARPLPIPFKHSAEASNRRKSKPFRSAMSMLKFLYQSRRQPSRQAAEADARSRQG